jgi:hypothetical protein
MPTPIVLTSRPRGHIWQRTERLGPHPMNRQVTIAALLAAALAAAMGGLAMWRSVAPDGRDRSRDQPVWTGVAWPFPLDQWGLGKAFVCRAADCGSEVRVYVRAKLGFCNCATGVATDDDLDRMSDFDLVGGEVTPLASGQPVRIGTMNGRDRVYALASSNTLGKSALSIVFNDRCDMVVATVLLPHDRPATIEPAVISFLNSPTILRWTEATLGL